MLSDMDEDSDVELIVFEVKKWYMNGLVNGYIRKDMWYRVNMVVVVSVNILGGEDCDCW